MTEGTLTLTVAPRIYANTTLGAAKWAYKWFDARGRLAPRELGGEVAAALLDARSAPAAG